MKLHTPEDHELMQVTAIEAQQDRLMVRGVIMGNMPMRAVLPPAQLRAGLRLLSWRLVFAVLAMLLRPTPR